MRAFAKSTGVVAVAALRKKPGRGRWEGGRGANFDGIIVTIATVGRTQQVVAAVALRKETRSRAVGRADAGQTSMCVEDGPL